jgi:Rrf2 family protein
MKLSTKSRYASRLMLRLAKMSSQGPVQLNEISKIENISEKYLSQIVIPLRNAQLIKSLRGAKGGYQLGKPAEQITLYDVVNVMEGGIEMVECVKDSFECNRSTHCVTMKIWSQMRVAMEETLSKQNLKELIDTLEIESDPMYYI